MRDSGVVQKSAVRQGHVGLLFALFHEALEFPFPSDDSRHCRATGLLLFDFAAVRHIVPAMQIAQ
jgi:hypothetical protein